MKISKKSYVISDVPAEVDRILKKKAKLVGKSMPEFILTLLSKEAKSQNSEKVKSSAAGCWQLEIDWEE